MSTVIGGTSTAAPPLSSWRVGVQADAGLGSISHFDSGGYVPTRGGTPARRADWQNPWTRDVLDAEQMELLDSCCRDWELLRHAETNERRARSVSYCHSPFCGVCTVSESHERAAGWVETFRALQDAADLDACGGFVNFTMPRSMSEVVASRSDRTLILDRLFRAVHTVMRGFGASAWVTVVHLASTKRPWVPHVHFPTFFPLLLADGTKMPGWVDRERFAARRRRLLGLWNVQLAEVCSEFGLDRYQAKVIHLAYVKDADRLAAKLSYELRPAVQDGFRHARQEPAQLAAALSLVLSFLEPEGAKTRVRRIRPGGGFSGRRITGFMLGVGLVRTEETPDGDKWVSEGPAVPVAVDLRAGTMSFRVVRTGEIVVLPLAAVSVAAHGASHTWTRAGPGGAGLVPGAR